MSAISAKKDLAFIDSKASLLPLLNSLNNLAVDPPSLYVDLEGIALGRHGSISTLSLYIAPTKKNYFIDIRKLGKAAFSITSNSGTSLKAVLESSTIPKTSVDSIKDLQLMELAARTGSWMFLSGLAGCIEKESLISTEAKTKWRLTKEGYQQLLALTKRDRYRVFNEGPPNLEITEYYKQKVTLLPALYKIYNAKLHKPGQSSNYDGNSKSNAFGWDEWTIENKMECWNDNIMMESLAGTHVLSGDDQWIEAPRDDLEDLLDQEEEPENDYYYDDYKDIARDCMGWEEDMIKNDEVF